MGKPDYSLKWFFVRYINYNFRLTVKWLGSIRIKPLVIDNKGGKENVLKELKQFANAQGRMITYPGTLKRIIT